MARREGALGALPHAEQAIGGEHQSKTAETDLAHQMSGEAGAKDQLPTYRCVRLVYFARSVATWLEARGALGALPLVKPFLLSREASRGNDTVCTPQRN